LALGADIRIVAPDARLSVFEIRWGLIPDMSGTARLAQLVRQDVALELVASGRIFSGVEAAQLGLATRVSETPLEDALALASAIAANSPSAVRAAKELVRSAYGGTDPVAQMAEERRVVRTLIGGRDQSEAVAAGLEKRPAVFLDD
jgi:enoyl-CoA hydratase/carnithine racemase